MKVVNIEIGKQRYKVEVACTEEDRIKGLQGRESLDEDKGMLFVFDEPDTIGFWMHDTKIPLDIIFIDEDMEVISVYQGEPENDDIAEEDDVQYVLEVNQGSGIKKGDELEIEDEDENLPIMKVIAPDGSTQMELEGGERIFSRKNTKVLISKAKKAFKYKKDNEKYERCCKSLGKYMFKAIKQQDSRKPEYVQKKE